MNSSILTVYWVIWTPSCSYYLPGMFILPPVPGIWTFLGSSCNCLYVQAAVNFNSLPVASDKEMVVLQSRTNWKAISEMWRLILYFFLNVFILPPFTLTVFELTHVQRSTSTFDLLNSESRTIRVIHYSVYIIVTVYIGFIVLLYRYILTIRLMRLYINPSHACTYYRVELCRFTIISLYSL